MDITLRVSVVVTPTGPKVRTDITPEAVTWIELSPEAAMQYARNVLEHATLASKS